MAHKKSQKDTDITSKIQEIDLDILGAALKNLEAQDEELQIQEAEQEAKKIESGEGDDDVVEALQEIGALKKER